MKTFNKLSLTALLISSVSFAQNYEVKPSQKCSEVISEVVSGDKVTIMSSTFENGSDLAFSTEFQGKLRREVDSYKRDFGLTYKTLYNQPLKVSYSRMMDGSEVLGYMRSMRSSNKYSRTKIYDAEFNLIQIHTSIARSLKTFDVCDGYELAAAGSSHKKYVEVISDRVDDFYNGLDDLQEEGLLKEVSFFEVPEELRTTQVNDYGFVYFSYAIMKNGKPVGYVMMSGDWNKYMDTVTLVFYTIEGEEVNAIEYDRG
jgi:hypothetical protein